MATGGEFSATLAGASEFVFEFCCSPCSKDGNIVEAVNQCCDEHFCGKCINLHKKFSPFSDHKVLGLEEMRKVKSSKPTKPLPPSQLCQEHGGDRFAIYCSQHDVVCCNTGVSIDHKNCAGTTYIVTTADGIKSSQQLQATKTSISSTLKDLKKGKSSGQSHLAGLDKDKASNIKQVEDFTERLIKRIRELKKATIEEITSNHKELCAGVGREVASLDDVISTMEGDLQKLDRSHGNHEAQVFVDVKLSQSHEAEGQTLLQQLNKPCKLSLKFQLKANIEELLKGLNSLGCFVNDSHVYKAKLKGEYNVKVKQDTDTCYIKGSCQLPDGTVVITDWNNTRLKRLDASYSGTDHYYMPKQPWGIICTAPDEVVVTITHQKKVQFVSMRGSMSLSRSFPTSDYCRGILCSGGKLFVSCADVNEKDSGHVSVYSLKGEQLNKVQTGPDGQNIFSLSYHITASCDGNKIYVAQYDGVVVLDRDGTLVGTITDPSLKCAMSLCTLDNGHILVCGRASNNVLQFDGDGRKVAETLKNTDGIKVPLSLCYDSRNSRLLIAMKNTDTFKVFDLM